MQRLLMVLVLLLSVVATRAQPEDYSRYPVYSGTDLGVTYSPTQSLFKVWAPTASEVQLILNDGQSDGNTVVPMKKDKNGSWALVVKKNLVGQRYAYRVKVKDKWMDMVTDPYAKAVNVNGQWGMVV